MSTQPIYLDYMATTPVDEAVVEHMQSFLTRDGVFGNPSSLHVYGEQAAKVVEASTQQAATVLGAADPSTLIWTSGATESNNLAIKSAAHAMRWQGRHIITACTEHKAVLEVCGHLQREGFEITYLKPNASGHVTPEQLKTALRDDTVLVSLMAVNNEIGTIQDPTAMSEVLASHQSLFHVDAAQAIGKIPVDLSAWQADFVSFSAHKCYGPKGVGLLYVKPNKQLRLRPEIYGGSQQGGLRGGTLAVQQIAGMALALSLAEKKRQERIELISEFHQMLWSRLKTLPGILRNGEAPTVPHVLNISFDQVDGAQLTEMLLPDLAFSSGSACNSVSMEPSHVLMALGRSHRQAWASLRFSFGRWTTQEDVEKTANCVEVAIARLS